MRKMLAMILTFVMAASATPALAFSFIPNEQAAQEAATQAPVATDAAEPAAGDGAAQGETASATEAPLLPEATMIPATEAPLQASETIAPATEAPLLEEEDQVPTQSAAETRYAKVATQSGTLNMRAEAKKDAKIVKKIARGTVVTVVEDLGDWMQIDYKGNIGYVMSSFMEAYDELPYAPITKENEGEAVMRFKETLQRLGYIKEEDVNKYFDKAMENALTKVQLMNGLALDAAVVSTEMQALVDWNMIVKGKSGYLDTATDSETGLSVSIYCWDSGGMIYADDMAVKVQITYAVQASGGQPPYAISVHKSLTGTGAAYGDEVTSPFSHIWREDTDRLYIYATVVDAAGNTVEACAPFRYVMPEIDVD